MASNFFKPDEKSQRENRKLALQGDENRKKIKILRIWKSDPEMDSWRRERKTKKIKPKFVLELIAEISRKMCKFRATHI